ncbi:PHB depolymerase family esterase [Ramlibacter sp. AN1015]|uniref:extracellular catalytic domain type 1 short-chain-length polyhydroxyalkanoate depolymerase n=1 Tax=Ramlibacter sp. AN1015 TaxID=3133428 RepID=UPI0030C22775
MYTDPVGSLDYTLYVPANVGMRPPLFVMLHGACQSASDFAAGTQMHEAVRECGGIALFPQQSRSAHPLGSWNWYDVKHQFASGGEPSMLAGLTRQIIRDHDADPVRVYVAGMSAGGAMAVILGQTYPDLYAAVGVHSGIATGVAHDLMSALRAMSSGPPGDSPAKGRAAVCASLPAVPTIVFHGDRDQTVHPLNAEAVLAQALNRSGGTPSRGDAASHTGTMNVPGGRAVTLVRHVRRKGRPDAEMWLVHGGGHAWTGGSAKGSFTDESGPDASREMLRFFLRQSLARCRGRKVA